MNNRHVDVTSTGREDLRAALSVLFRNAAGGKATHWLDLPSEHEAGKLARPRTLVLLWHEDRGALPLPTPLGLEGATDLATMWLDALKSEDRFGWVSMDGDCLPEGFRAFCEDWGHVFGMHYAFAGVQGCYAWYGK